MFDPRRTRSSYGLLLREGSPHKAALDQIESHSIVLDIGCGKGLLGAVLKQRGCTVYGIEIFEEDAQVAKENLDDVFVADIENVTELPFPHNSFDYILMLDVIEHLKRPDLVLCNIKRYLRPTGKLLVSVPNVAYWRVRANILFGKFDYSNGGIFDRTHLRFFTKDTILQLLRECGYKPILIKPLGWAMRVIPANLRNPFSGLFGYQFFIACGKES